MNIYVYYMQPRCVCVCGGGGGGSTVTVHVPCALCPASYRPTCPIQIGYTTITLFIS